MDGSNEIKKNTHTQFLYTTLYFVFFFFHLVVTFFLFLSFVHIFFSPSLLSLFNILCEHFISATFILNAFRSSPCSFFAIIAIREAREREKSVHIFCSLLCYFCWWCCRHRILCCRVYLYYKYSIAFSFVLHVTYIPLEYIAVAAIAIVVDLSIKHLLYFIIAHI